MHTVALFCGCYVNVPWGSTWNTYPYPPGILRWPVKQPRRIWVNIYRYQTTIKAIKREACAYLLRSTVFVHQAHVCVYVERYADATKTLLLLHSSNTCTAVTPFYIRIPADLNMHRNSYGVLIDRFYVMICNLKVPSAFKCVWIMPDMCQNPHHFGRWFIKIPRCVTWTSMF